MRNWLLLMLFTFSSAVLQAEEKETSVNLFTCVDKQTLSVDDSCIQTLISHKVHSQDEAINFEALSGELGENTLATMHFYPEKMLIKIVGHLDESNAGLTANAETK